MDINSDAMKNIHSDLAKLRQQLENIIKSAETKKKDTYEDIINKLKDSLKNIQNDITIQDHKFFAFGESGYKTINEYVSKNPISSVLLAFGAGFIFSHLTRKIR